MKIKANELRRWIEERATLQGECWVWRLAMVRGESPQGRYQGQTLYVRRAIVQARSGTPLPRNWFATCSCGTTGCVRPEHVVAVSRADAAKGKPKNALHRLRVAAGKQAAGKLDWQKVNEIRESDETTRVLAHRYGVCATYISQIKQYRTWRTPVMLAGLGVRSS